MRKGSSANSCLKGWIALTLVRRRRVPPDAAEMGERKSRTVFQAVAQRAIDADMRQPDHRDGKDKRRGDREASDHQRHRGQIAVRGVIDDGANLRAREI